MARSLCFSKSFYNGRTRLKADERVNNRSSIRTESQQNRLQFSSVGLTPSGERPTLAVVREQIAVGSFEAGERTLAGWVTKRQRFRNLSFFAALCCRSYLFTVGTLIGYDVKRRCTTRGQRQAESLLSGAIALFEHLGLQVRAAETRIELGRCYYREGLFDMARV